MIKIIFVNTKENPWKDEYKEMLNLFEQEQFSIHHNEFAEQQGNIEVIQIQSEDLLKYLGKEHYCEYDCLSFVENGILIIREKGRGYWYNENNLCK